MYEYLNATYGSHGAPALQALTDAMNQMAGHGWRVRSVTQTDPFFVLVTFERPVQEGGAEA